MTDLTTSMSFAAVLPLTLAPRAHLIGRSLARDRCLGPRVTRATAQAPPPLCQHVPPATPSTLPLCPCVAPQPPPTGQHPGPRPPPRVHPPAGPAPRYVSVPRTDVLYSPPCLPCLPTIEHPFPPVAAPCWLPPRTAPDRRIGEQMFVCAPLYVRAGIEMHRHVTTPATPDFRTRVRKSPDCPLYALCRDFMRWRPWASGRPLYGPCRGNGPCLGARWQPCPRPPTDPSRAVVSCSRHNPCPYV